MDLDPTVLAILAFVVVLGGAGAAVWVMRSRGQKAADETFHHFRCANCKRRIRYLAKQVGRKGECSNCGKEVLFPPVSQSID